MTIVLKIVDASTGDTAYLRQFTDYTIGVNIMREFAANHYGKKYYAYFNMISEYYSYNGKHHRNTYDIYSYVLEKGKCRSKKP